MMRYQRLSPECLPLSNGRKSNLRTCKEDDVGENGRTSSCSNLEGKALRFRSGTSPSNNSPDKNFSHFVIADGPPQSENHSIQKNQSHESSPSPSPNRGVDVLLQWGHNKRSRRSRSESRSVTDESSVQGRQVIKIHRRLVPGLEKQSSTTTTMPPPLPPCTTASSYIRGGNLRPCTPLRESTSSHLSRNSEDRLVIANGSPSRSNGGGSSISRGIHAPVCRSSPSPERSDKIVSSSGPGAKGDNKPKGSGSTTAAAAADPVNHRVESATAAPSEQEAAGTTAAAAGAGGVGEKVNLDPFEWSRIYVSLSRKEKEDDFLAMKGTKLPQRPKKRAKNIDKTLQYCFPGMWLSDLTRGRYEVREKKCVKKQKKRGLKGMESMDSDSE
ncbi:serine/threonine-protein kinase pakG [Telopea speciosissima]|uniref:serine/threonine-protein kinase pakG n=1 Tax=Telopea speciosissima TaxID=54955 RepID=UPI001CC65EC0|nr:serine/threonine-protein kinase pakG [Telopea speciosissima]